jgi:ABC-type branched-subunit amino acid transport system substrate-binding protein
LLFAPLWEPQVASLYAKLAPKKRKITLLTSDTIDGRPEFVKLLGPLSPDIRFIFSNYWNGRIEGPFAEKYSAMQRKYCSQYPVSRVSAAAFDAINLVVEAVKKGPTKNRSEFVKRMKDLKLQGLTGALVFDESNDPKKPLQLFEIRGSKPTYWKEYQ